MATPNMGLNLPVVGATIGPDWAAMLIAALSVNGVDSHDHSSGKGTKVTVAGLNILADLNFQNARPIGLGGAKFVDVVSQSGLAVEPGQIARLANDFYIVDGAGNIIPLTLGGKVTLPGRAALSVIGNATNGAAAATDLAASLDNQSLQRQGSALAWTTQATLPSAKSISLSNITLSGPQTVSGAALAAGDVCLSVAQSTPGQNGLYIVQTGAWTRHPAAATTGQIQPGQTCAITSGACFGTVMIVGAASAPIIGTNDPFFAPVGDLSYVASGTASSVSFPMTANLFSRLNVRLQLGSGTISNITLTSMTAGTYGSVVWYSPNNNVVGGIEDVTLGVNINNNWLMYGNAFNGDFDLPPAPLVKSFYCYGRDGTASRTLMGKTSDTTHDPTAVVFTFSGSVVYRLKIKAS